MMTATLKTVLHLESVKVSRSLTVERCCLDLWWKCCCWTGQESTSLLDGPRRGNRVRVAGSISRARSGSVCQDFGLWTQQKQHSRNLRIADDSSKHLTMERRTTQRTGSSWWTMPTSLESLQQYMLKGNKTLKTKWPKIKVYIYSGVNESEKKFHIKEIFKDKNDVRHFVLCIPNVCYISDKLVTQTNKHKRMSGCRHKACISSSIKSILIETSSVRYSMFCWSFLDLFHLSFEIDFSFSFKLISFFSFGFV